MSKSTELFKQGYNCAQAVFCSYCEKYGIDYETGLKLSSSFGGGMGRLREVCGAVSAAFMLLGLKYGYTDCNNDLKKEEHYARIQEFAKIFKKEFGSIICKELLSVENEDISPVPTKRDTEFYKSRPCIKYIEFVSKLLDKEL